MSNIVNDYLYTRDCKQNVPSWYRLERYDYCDTFSKNSFSEKRGIFSRLSARKNRK